MKLSDLALVRIDLPEAHFWIIRSHDLKTIGKPVREHASDYIGVLVVREDVLNPEYLFYMVDHLWRSGAFAPLARGSLKLVHLPVDAIAGLRLHLTE